MSGTGSTTGSVRLRKELLGDLATLSSREEWGRIRGRRVWRVGEETSGSAVRALFTTLRRRISAKCVAKLWISQYRGKVRLRYRFVGVETFKVGFIYLYFLER